MDLNGLVSTLLIGYVSCRRWSIDVIIRFNLGLPLHIVVIVELDPIVRWYEWLLLLLIHVHLAKLLLRKLIVSVQLLLTSGSLDPIHLLRGHLLLHHFLLFHLLETILTRSCCLTLLLSADGVRLHIDRDHKGGEGVAAHDPAIVHDVLRGDLPISTEYLGFSLL